MEDLLKDNYIEPEPLEDFAKQTFKEKFDKYKELCESKKSLDGQQLMVRHLIFKINFSDKLQNNLFLALCILFGVNKRCCNFFQDMFHDGSGLYNFSRLLKRLVQIKENLGA